VDFSTASLSLDGQPVTDTKIDLDAFTISYMTEIGDQGKPMKILDSGVHTVTVTAKDYKGNLLRKDWFFTADNTLPVPKRSAPAIPGKKTKEPEGKSFPRPPSLPAPPRLDSDRASGNRPPMPPATGGQDGPPNPF
jgi:hypothetical protein